MKRALSIIFFVICLFGCTSVVNEDVVQHNSTDVSSITIPNRINYADILMHINSSAKHDGVKSGSDKIIPIKEKGDTVMYLVNYSDGWELLSTDRRLPFILASCEHGSISESELFGNEATTAYFRTISEFIHNISSSNEEAPLNNNRSSSMPYSFYDEDGVYWVYVDRYPATVSTRKQDPLLETHWGQGDSVNQWNICAPYTNSSMSEHCLTGCVMVAAAQVLYHMHYAASKPQKSYRYCTCTAYVPNGSPYVTLNDNNVSFADYSNCWNVMPQVGGASVGSAAYETVSSLMVHLGYLLNAHYGVTGTSADLGNLPNVLSYNYNVSCSYRSWFDIDIAIDQLCDNHRPVIVRLLDNSYTIVPHAIIINGYRKITTRYTYVYKNMDNGETRYKYLPYTEAVEDFNYNWGFDGDGDISPSTGNPIWYAIIAPLTVTANGIQFNYDTFDQMVYGFNAS